MQKIPKEAGSLRGGPPSSCQTMEVLPKAIIRTWILPRSVDLPEVAETILFKLKTGYQWRQLPFKQFFYEYGVTQVGGIQLRQQVAQRWQLEKLWGKLFQVHRRRLD